MNDTIDTIDSIDTETAWTHSQPRHYRQIDTIDR